MDQPAHAKPPRAQVRHEFRCVSCNYSIRGRAVEDLCPECGTPVLHSVGKTPPPAGIATASFVLGLLSIAGVMTMGLLSLLCAPPAIIFACMTFGRVKRQEAPESSRGLAIAGLVTGIIGALIALGFGAYVIFIYAAFAGGAHGP